MSAFTKLAEAMATGGLRNVEFSTSRVNHRRLTVDEIKQTILEEFGDVKDSEGVEVDEKPGGWGDAELASNIEWVKALDLREYFKK